MTWIATRVRSQMHLTRREVKGPNARAAATLCGRYVKPRHLSIRGDTLFCSTCVRINAGTWNTRRSN